MVHGEQGLEPLVSLYCPGSQREQEVPGPVYPGLQEHMVVSEVDADRHGLLVMTLESQEIHGKHDPGPLSVLYWPDGHGRHVAPK